MHPPSLTPPLPHPLPAGLSVREEAGRWVVRLEWGERCAQEYACPTREKAERLLALLVTPARPARPGARS